jgi:hypothetical protein
MTLLEKLVATENSTLLALINPYRHSDEDDTLAPSRTDKHQTLKFGKSAFRKTHWDKKG